MLRCSSQSINSDSLAKGSSLSRCHLHSIIVFSGLRSGIRFVVHNFAWHSSIDWFNSKRFHAGSQTLTLGLRRHVALIEAKTALVILPLKMLLLKRTLRLSKVLKENRCARYRGMVTVLRYVLSFVIIYNTNA